jgi:FkbM family methyltransferase
VSFEGVRYLAARALQRRIIGPRELRKFDAQSGPVLHRSPFGLTFELIPGEYVDRNIVFDGIYEARFLAWAASQLTSDSVVLDIGANIGNHALYLSKHCAVVHCFDPNPRALKRLRRNIALNDIKNIVVHSFGLGDKDEIGIFYDNIGTNLGCGSFVAPQGETQEIQLPLRNAADAVSELNLERIDLIKMDVEHMEEVVLRALTPVLKRYKPMIAFEFDATTKTAADFERIREILYGFDLFEPVFSPAAGGILERLKWNLRNAGTPDLVPISVIEPRTYENVIARPSE